MSKLEVTSVDAKNRLLENGIAAADKFINKNYLIRADWENIIPISSEDKTANAIRLFKITKLIYDKKENINDKLISVYSALQEVNSSALLIISGSKTDISFYIGIRTKENAPIASRILEKSFIGNFPGSTLKSMRNVEIEETINECMDKKYTNTQKSIASVTIVPSMRDEDKEKFVQGMEKFTDTMQGSIYTALFIARPASKQELEARKHGFEEIYSSLSSFEKTTLAYGENYSKAVTAGMFENFSHSINNGISNTTGSNVSTSTGESEGVSTSYELFGITHGQNTNRSKGRSSGRSWSESVTTGTADTIGKGSSTSDTETSGDSRTLTIEHQNKTVITLLERIDEQLERIKKCEAYGIWECAAYFIADSIQTSVVAANAYKALMLGDKTAAENAFVNVWGARSSEQTNKVLEYIKSGMHPLIEIDTELGYEKQYVTPGNYISGQELPLFMGVPHKSVMGLTVSSIAEFGRNVFVQNEKPDQIKIKIGNIYHMGNTEASAVELDLNSFASHCFITGSTGSGKSNTTYKLLEQLINHKVPFLVVEPAKGEYKEAFGSLQNINIFTTNPLIGQLLKLNPFKFEPNIHILEHLDRLIEIFNACWEMYAAMPAILKDAVEKTYIKKGWDILNSVYLGKGEPEFPTFEDLMDTLPKVIDSSGYSSDTKGDYIGALVTRVSSLTNGISGQIFCDNYDIPDQVLFDENTIVDLSRVGSTETKSLIMGIIVLKLTEYRMARAEQANSNLRHITVLEEAVDL